MREDDSISCRESSRARPGLRIRLKFIFKFLRSMKYNFKYDHHVIQKVMQIFCLPAEYGAAAESDMCLQAKFLSYFYLIKYNVKFFTCKPKEEKF